MLSLWNAKPEKSLQEGRISFVTDYIPMIRDELKRRAVSAMVSDDRTCSTRLAARVLVFVFIALVEYFEDIVSIARSSF